MSRPARISPRRPRGRPPRALVASTAAFACEVARRLSPVARVTVVTIDEATRSDVRLCGTDLLRHHPSGTMAPHDAVVIAVPPGGEDAHAFEGLRALARRAADACPRSVLILDAEDGLPLAPAMARWTGLDPAQVVAAAGLPFAMGQRRHLARRHGICAAQVDLVAIGAESASSLRFPARFARAAGVPLADLGVPARREAAQAPVPTTADRVEAVAAIARAVLQDRGAVLCCGTHTGEARGVPGGWITGPVRIGARGAGDPIPLRLTAEEHGFLHAVAVLDSETPAWVPRVGVRD